MSGWFYHLICLSFKKFVHQRVFATTRKHLSLRLGDQRPRPEIVLTWDQRRLRAVLPPWALLNGSRLLAAVPPRTSTNLQQFRLPGGCSRPEKGSSEGGAASTLRNSTLGNDALCFETCQMIAFGTWTTIFNRKLKPFWLKSPLLLLLERNLVQIDNLARLPEGSAQSFRLKSPPLLLLERNLVQINNLARLPERRAESMMTTSHFQYTQVVTTASLHPRLTHFLHNQMMSTTNPKMMQLLRIRMGPPCPT